VKLHDVRLCGGEDCRERLQKFNVGRVVGPQREYSTGLQEARETAQTCGLVERAVIRMQQVTR
jgi:hypothetical protein